MNNAQHNGFANSNLNEQLRQIEDKKQLNKLNSWNNLYSTQTFLGNTPELACKKCICWIIWYMILRYALYKLHKNVFVQNCNTVTKLQLYKMYWTYKMYQTNNVKYEKEG
jgi:hypothetical protein